MWRPALLSTTARRRPSAWLSALHWSPPGWRSTSRSPSIPSSPPRPPRPPRSTCSRLRSTSHARRGRASSSWPTRVPCRSGERRRRSLCRSVGTTWWLVAAAKSPLAGRFPNAAPYVVLAFGLLLALAVGSVIEVVVRRQRYASSLVAERTAELLASQEALVRSERLSAVGQMTTVVGHELRNPLGAVMNSLYMLRRSLGDPAAAEPHLAVAERQTARAVNLAQDLTAYMRENEPELAPLELRDVLDDVLEATPMPPNVEVRLGRGFGGAGRPTPNSWLRSSRTSSTTPIRRCPTGARCVSPPTPTPTRSSSRSRTAEEGSTRPWWIGSSSRSSPRDRMGQVSAWRS